ncbi:MAG: YihY/virulence factor BrkB family protein [Saprospiraceae bacterium]
MKQWMKNTFNLIRETVTDFTESNPGVFAASLSYYTMLSLPSMLVLIIISAGALLGEEAASGKLYQQIQGLVGPSSAEAIQNIVQNVNQTGGSALATILSIITLIISATTVLLTLQNALNHIWGVKVQAKSKWWLKTLTDRVFSMAMVVSLGFLLAVSLLMDTAISAIQGSLQNMLGETSVYLIWIVNNVISLGIATVVFAMIFKILPDVILRWKDVWVGAFFTTVLFIIGKFLIGLYLGNSSLTDTYGAAGSIVVVLIWVYYSSMIVLFGAECTQVYARRMGNGIEPSRYAVRVETQVVDSEEKKFEKTNVGATADKKEPEG